MSFIRNNYEPNCTHYYLDQCHPKIIHIVRPVIKEAILKEQKEPKMAKEEAKKEEILNRKEPQKRPKQKISKKNDSEKRQNKAQTIFVFRKKCYICSYV